MVAQYHLGGVGDPHERAPFMKNSLSTAKSAGILSPDGKPRLVDVGRRRAAAGNEGLTPICPEPAERIGFPGGSNRPNPVARVARPSRGRV